MFNPQSFVPEAEVVIEPGQTEIPVDDFSMFYAPNTDHERFGPIPEQKWLFCEDLASDAGYQRSIEAPDAQKHIEKIAKAFQWGYFQPVIVGERADGTYVVIDGQHRTEAARRCGILIVPCSVIPYGDVASEAGAFVAVNRERRQLTSVDIYRSAIMANDPDALVLKEIFEAAGVKVGKTSSSSNLAANELVAVKACYDTVATHGEEVLRKTLLAIKCAYTGEPGSSLTSQLITCVASIYGEFEHHPAFNEDRLVETIGQRKPKEWLTTGRNLADALQMKGPLGLRVAVVRAFNKGLHQNKRLPEQTVEEVTA